MSTLFRKNDNGMKSPQLKGCDVFQIQATTITATQIQISVLAWVFESEAKAGGQPNVLRIFDLPHSEALTMEDIRSLLFSKSAIISNAGETVDFTSSALT
jgi:hypothetical protein